MMATHIDYDEEAKKRVWFLESTGGLVSDGLTIRDYFAAHALQGSLAGKYQGSMEDFVADAYALADAMMKERAK